MHIQATFKSREAFMDEAEFNAVFEAHSGILGRIAASYEAQRSARDAEHRSAL